MGVRVVCHGRWKRVAHTGSVAVQVVVFSGPRHDNVLVATDGHSPPDTVTWLRIVELRPWVTRHLALQHRRTSCENQSPDTRLGLNSSRQQYRPLAGVGLGQAVIVGSVRVDTTRPGGWPSCT